MHSTVRFIYINVKQQLCAKGKNKKQKKQKTKNINLNKKNLFNKQNIFISVQ